MKFNPGYSVFYLDLKMYALGEQLRVVRTPSGRLFLTSNKKDYITFMDEYMYQTGV